MVISELAPPATAQVISMQHPQILSECRHTEAKAMYCYKMKHIAMLKLSSLFATLLGSTSASAVCGMMVQHQT
jgi:hypothetical protein